MLKRMWALNNITVQGWRKATVHCYLVLIEMQAGRLVRREAYHRKTENLNKYPQRESHNHDFDNHM